jgi:hypothetical protein
MPLPSALKKQTAATRGYRSRTDTINLIYSEMFKAHAVKGETERELGWRSCNDIAKEILGRKGKYPILWEILEHLVRIGWLEEKLGLAVNSKDVRLFRAIKYTKSGDRVY